MVFYFRHNKFIINTLQDNKLRLPIFELWFTNYNIFYNFDDKLQIFYPSNYSEKIQKISTNIYFPILEEGNIEWYYLALS